VRHTSVRDGLSTRGDQEKKWIEPAARTVYVGVISIDTLRWTLKRKKKEKERQGGIIDEKAKKREKKKRVTVG
jgi:hypothetical protein